MSTILRPAADPVDGAHGLVERLSELVMDCPVDGMCPGYELALESKAECAEAIAALNEAARLLTQCNSREEPRYRACSDAVDAEVAHG